MSDSETQLGDYCANLVRARDEDRWLAAQYASDTLKPALLALYAFHGELRRIPGAVSEPPLGEIRLQWWREALAEIVDGKSPRAHPVVEAMSMTNIVRPELMALFEAAIDATSRTLYGEGFETVDDLASWLEDAEGTIDSLALRLAGIEENDAVKAVATGAVFALAREGRAFAPDLADNIDDHVKRHWHELRKGLSQLDGAMVPAILHLALTPSYLKRTAKPFPILKRAKLFAAMAIGRF